VFRKCETRVSKGVLKLEQELKNNRNRRKPAENMQQGRFKEIILNSAK
jgi:hypothetical protein